MKVIYKGTGLPGRDARSQAADRFGDRRDEDRRLGSAGDGDPERRSGTDRRTAERRVDDPTTFTREGTRRIVKLITHPEQSALLKRGRLSCPSCRGQLRAKSPLKWKGRAVWEVRCLTCGRALIHKTAS